MTSKDVAAAAVLVIQPDPLDPLFEIEGWFREAGLRWECVRPSVGEPVPDALEAHGLVVLGGDMSSLDDEGYPWLEDVRNLQRIAAADGKPSLGICLGGQLMAQAFGGATATGDQGLEAGVAVVDWLPDAEDDELVAGLPAPFRAGTMHGDMIVDLPPGSVWLGRGADYPHQVFRVGRTSWGVQFHPEVDHAAYQSWVDMTKYASGENVRRLVEGGHELSRREAEVLAGNRALVSNFGALVRDRAGSRGSGSALLKQHADRHYPTAVRGEGVFLYDSAGRRYLDGSGGPMTASIGHGVVQINDAVRAQLDQVAFTYRTQFTNEPAENLARRLVDLAPGDLGSAFFVSSGSEATEYAMRASVGHWKMRGRPEKVKVLGRQISYHGMTLGALSMSGHAARRPDYGTLLQPFPVLPPAYAFRFARSGESDEAYGERAAAELEAAIVEQDAATVAAVILEPIVGAAGGVLVPPSGYLSRVREVCDRQDVLLILDEVITGMGRTGDWFACAAEGVVPDLLVLGKGLSGGYTPMAGVLLRDHLVETIRAGSGVAPFGHTFSGNPLGAATCLAVIDYLEHNDVLANTRARGEQLEAGLHELAARFPQVADIRGRGLLWGFEFVLDPETRAAPNPKDNISGAFVDECFERGLIVYPAGIAPWNNAIILSPPLNIAEGEVDLLLDILGRAIEHVSALPILRSIAN